MQINRVEIERLKDENLQFLNKLKVMPPAIRGAFTVALPFLENEKCKAVRQIINDVKNVQHSTSGAESETSKELVDLAKEIFLNERYKLFFDNKAIPEAVALSQGNTNPVNRQSPDNMVANPFADPNIALVARQDQELLNSFRENVRAIYAAETLSTMKLETSAPIDLTAMTQASNLSDNLGPSRTPTRYNLRSNPSANTSSSYNLRSKNRPKEAGSKPKRSGPNL
ncbi:hypothetical protein FGM00_11200 [Aggregatimonas sangjinii]|uniref:Uncharacterized protein n=1 Tax=Aggregatimonas sangjinii TaxID=2583587 RepID=A0A5B7SU70_9FLAO|nr:hypothetical protein [Aggregatimonas sangjinii]QCX00643.1 hypothetical protein FGM00_11200 [Aggregatimonas sangjinii]